MKTRFNSTEVWRTNTKTVEIRHMESDYIINVLAMFINKPENTLSMLISDIEHYSEYGTFSPFSQDEISESLFNASSMSRESLIKFAMTSPVAETMKSELRRRGINVKNVLALRTEKDQSYKDKE